MRRFWLGSLITIVFVAFVAACEFAATDGEQPVVFESAIDGTCGTLPSTPADFEAGKTYSDERWVANSGNDSNSGTYLSPYQTIARAWQDRAPGMSIFIKSGTYGTTTLTMCSGTLCTAGGGTVAAPIWIGGEPGQPKPEFNGGGEGLKITKARYLILHDIKVRNTASNGVNIDDGSERSNPEAARYVIVRNVDFVDIGDATGTSNCLKLTGLNDFIVRDSTFTRCGMAHEKTASGDGIDLVGCDRGLIARNTFKTRRAVQVKGGSEDVEIRANDMTWSAVTPSGGTPPAFNLGGKTGTPPEEDFWRPPFDLVGENIEAKNIRLIANVIRGGYSAANFAGCVDCIVANNTIMNPEDWVIRLAKENFVQTNVAHSRNGKFVNNLIYWDSDETGPEVQIHEDYTSTEAGSFRLIHNLWYPWNDPNQTDAAAISITSGKGLTHQTPIVRSTPEPGSPLTFSGMIPDTNVAATRGTADTWTVGGWGDKRGRCFGYPNASPSSAPVIGAYEAVPANTTAIGGFYKRTSTDTWIEAENSHGYHGPKTTAAGSPRWVTTTFSGYSGSAAMEISPNNGSTFTAASGVALEYQVWVDTVDNTTYYLWLRAAGPTTSAKKVFVGANHTASPIVMRVAATSWNWTKDTNTIIDNFPLTYAPATITLKNGFNTIVVSANDDGFKLDKILLRTGGHGTDPDSVGDTKGGAQAATKAIGQNSDVISIDVEYQHLKNNEWASTPGSTPYHRKWLASPLRWAAPSSASGYGAYRLEQAAGSASGPGNPEISYAVKFDRVGRHYVWVRNKKESSSDPGTVWVGLDGEAWTYDKIRADMTDSASADSSWTWFGEAHSPGAFFDVPNTGYHWITVWGSDQFQIDKIVLTKDPTDNWSGTSTGPTVTGLEP